MREGNQSSKQITFEGNESLNNYRLKDVSLITINDNSWPTFQLATDFDDINKEFVLYALLVNETLFSI